MGCEENKYVLTILTHLERNNYLSMYTVNKVGTGVGAGKGQL